MGMYFLFPFTRFPDLGTEEKNALERGCNTPALDRKANANHHFDDRTIAHFAAQNIFPLQAPDALFDNDVEKYDRLLERKSKSY